MTIIAIKEIRVMEVGEALILKKMTFIMVDTMDLITWGISLVDLHFKDNRTTEFYHPLMISDARITKRKGKFMVF